MTGRIKVCHLISTAHPIIGGVQRATENLCHSLANCGVEVVMLTRRFPGLSDTDESSNIPIFRLGLPVEGKLGALTFALHAMWKLSLEMRDFQIVHVQNIDTPLLTGILCKIFLARRLVTTIHGEQKILSRQRSVWGKLRLRLMYAYTDDFTALTDEIYTQLIEAGIAIEKVHKIPNGIDTAKFHPPTLLEKRTARRQLDLEDSQIVVLYLGRLVRLKRVDLLLLAWSRLDGDLPRTLLIVGDGPEYESLASLANDLRQTTTIRFEGPADDVLSYFHAADAFVLPSQQEGLSVALLEAMASGLPALVTQLPANREVINHGVSGLKIPVDDLDELTEKLQSLIDSSLLREQIGQSACGIIKTTYSQETIAAEHRALYDNIL